MFLSFIAAITLASPLASATEGPPLILWEGEQRLFLATSEPKTIVRYSIGNPAIVRAAAPPPSPHSGLLLRGQKPGLTDLWVFFSDQTSEHRSIEVRPPLKVSNLSAGAIARQRALADLQEVEVIFSAEKALLQGEFRTVSEGRRIQSLRELYPDTLIDHTAATPMLAQAMKTEVEAWLRTQNEAKNLSLKCENQTCRLMGSCAHPSQRSAIEARAKRLFPGIITEIEALPDQAPTLFFKVYLLEIRKTEATRLGLSWPESPGSVQIGLGGLRTLVSLELALQTLQRSGSIRVLSQPEIAVRVPGEAELFAGGELPIRTENRWGSSVQWKSFGLLFKLKTLARAGNRVRLELQSETSHLDSSLSKTAEIPGLQSNRLKTQVDAEIDQPLFLSGLLQKKEEGGQQGPAGLSFLGVHNRASERSELVAVLTPLLAPSRPSAITEATSTIEPPLSKARRIAPLPLPTRWSLGGFP